MKIILVVLSIFILFSLVVFANVEKTTLIIKNVVKVPTGYKPSPMLELAGLSYGYKYNQFRSQFEFYEVKT